MDNMVGTAHTIDYARKLDSLERFAYFSTDEIFGPAPFELTMKMIDIILPIHILLLKPEERSL